MKDEILREKLINISPKQELLINEYMKNDMQKLKKITYHIFKGFNIPNSEHDELYDKAMNILMESAVSYDENNEANFNTFLIGNIKRKVSTWYRDNYQRGKRKNLLRDENGNIVYEIDSNGKKTPVIISDISFDAPASDDDVDLNEKIASDFNIENESKINFSNDEKVTEFMDSLSSIQRKILELKMDGYGANEIKEKLNISDVEYQKYMKQIRTNEKLELFAKTEKYKEDINMNIMPIDVTDSYRMDKYPLGTLLDEKRDKKINCKYILQRQPFQWTKKQKNKFLTRILNNQPIPEIVICEQIVGDKKKRHLIDGLQRLSYSAQYRARGSVIESEGAEFPDIYYTEYVYNENGEVVLDEDGDPKVEKKVFNVIGKRFDQLPSFLQERFNKFNVNVTTFFNCTDEQIAYHLRNYNNQAPMNNNQYDLSCMNPEIAEMVKNISQNNLFFKDKYGKYTNSNDTKGAIDRLVMESIMSINFLSDWKDKTNLLFPYIEEHATKDMFDSLNSLFTRLCNVVTKETKELFNTSNTPAWIAVFNEFTKYHFDDIKFKEFIEYFTNNLSDLVIDGEKFEKLYKDNHPKNKGIITPKITKLISLMKDYLHIKENECVDDILDDLHIETKEDKYKVENNTSETDDEDVLNFVKENANPEATENDIDECYELIDYAKNKLHGFNKESTILDYHNENALIAIFAYALKNNIDLDQWLVKVSNQNNVYSENQKENYTYMINSLNNYVQATA